MTAKTLESNVPRTATGDLKRKSFTFTLDPNALEKIQVAAKKANMSVSKFLETGALWYAEDLREGRTDRLLTPIGKEVSDEFEKQYGRRPKD